MKDLTIAPENLTVANVYLELSSIEETRMRLRISTEEVVQILAKPEVKRYVDNIYMDVGYRNKFKLAAVLDEQIDNKLREMEETEMTSKKDILDLLTLAHKFRMDEIKAETDLVKASQGPAKTIINSETNNSFGGGQYGKLMQDLLIEGEVK